MKKNLIKIVSLFMVLCLLTSNICYASVVLADYVYQDLVNISMVKVKDGYLNQ